MVQISAGLDRQIVDLYRQIVSENIRQLPYDASSRTAFGSWQRRARFRLKKILGELPRERIGFGLQRKVVEDGPRYTMEHLQYWTRPGLQAVAYLLTPKGVTLPAPGMLCLHGHSNGGKDESIDPDSIYRGFGRTFAEAGCVVLCPEQIGFGERAFEDERVTYNVLVHGLNMVGHTLIGLRYWDLVRSLDLLQEEPTVVKRRMGVMGLSLGGEMTLFLAALQTRLRAACVGGYLSTHLHSFLDRPHCTCGHMRDLAKYFEHVDLAALIAPRPLFLDTGRKDKMFPVKDARDLVRQLRQVYDLFDRPEPHLGIHAHGGGHEISCKRSVPWMLQRLRD